MSIFTLCQPMLDKRKIFRKADIVKYGLSMNGYMAAEETHKAALAELDAQNDYIVLSGGSSLNTFRWLASNVDIDLCYLGAIGKDKNGETLRNIIKDDKINFLLEEISDKKTAECRVLLTKSERSLFTSLGAANQLSKAFFENNISKMQSFKIIYTSTFIIKAYPEYTTYMLDNKKDHIFVYNLGSCTLINEDIKDNIIAAYNKSEVIIGNYDEFSEFYKLLFGENDVKIHTKVSKLSDNKKFSVCTNGPHPIIFSYNNNDGSLVMDVKQLELECLDTCGAGDIFAAGILYGVSVNGFSKFEETVKLAQCWAYENVKMRSLALIEQST